MMFPFMVIVAMTLPFAFATLPLLTIFLIQLVIFFILPFPLFPLLMVATARSPKTSSITS